jgi:hypothetical protein
MRGFLWGAVFFSLASFSIAATNFDQGKDFLSKAQSSWTKSRLSLEGGYDDSSYGTLDALLPFMGNDDFMIYANASAKANANNALAGNLGFGFRRVNDAETSIFGMYAFYDILQSSQKNQFQQTTIGIEHLGTHWDFRANAYVPVGPTKITKEQQNGEVLIQGHDITEAIQANIEEALGGGDLEVGRLMKNGQWRTYFAIYSFGTDFTGPRARVEYYITKNLALITTVQYDKQRAGQYFIGGRFSIGGARVNSGESLIYSRMTDQVVRNQSIVTKNDSYNYSQTFYNKYWRVDNTVTGGQQKGTIEAPFSSVEAAVKEAPEGALIDVRGTADPYSLSNKNIALKSGQVLSGSAVDLYLGSLLVSPGNGISPILNTGRITMNNSTTLQGLTLQSYVSNGVTVNNLNHVNINHVSISGATDAGLYINNSQNVELNTLTLSNNTGAGLNAVNSNVTANTLTMTANEGDAGLIANGGTQTYTNIDSHENVKDGIQVLAGNISFNTLDVLKNNIDGGGDGGVVQKGGILSIANGNINENENGFYMEGGSATIANTIFSTNQFNGLLLQEYSGKSSSVNLIESTIEKNENNGVKISNNTDLNMTDTVVNENINNGLAIEGGDVTIHGGEINGNQQDGIAFSGSYDKVVTLEDDVRIQNNEGNGVNLSGKGSFAMRGGEISGSGKSNAPKEGIYVNDPNVSMLIQNVDISHNTGNGILIDNIDNNTQTSILEDIQVNYNGQNSIGNGIEIHTGRIRFQGQNNINYNEGTGLYANCTTLTCNLSSLDEVGGQMSMSHNGKYGVFVDAIQGSSFSFYDLLVEHNTDNGLNIGYILTIYDSIVQNNSLTETPPPIDTFVENGVTLYSYNSILGHCSGTVDVRGSGGCSQ